MINKKPYKEIEGYQSFLATSKIYDVAKNTISYWIKKPTCFEAAKENQCIEKEETDEISYIRWIGQQQMQKQSPRGAL